MLFVPMYPDAPSSEGRQYSTSPTRMKKRKKRLKKADWLTALLGYFAWRKKKQRQKPGDLDDELG